MKNVLFFVSLIFFTIQAYSQDHILRGTVTEDNKPLQGVTVLAVGTNIGTRDRRQWKLFPAAKAGRVYYFVLLRKPQANAGRSQQR